MRRLAIAILIAPLVGLAGLSLLSPSAHASTPVTTPVTTAATGDGPAVDASHLAPVDVLQVSGLFDKIIVDSITEAIDDSEPNGAAGADPADAPRGAVVSRRRDDRRCCSAVADARCRSASGSARRARSRAYGLPAQLLAVADVTAMVGGSRIGYIGSR